MVWLKIPTLVHTDTAGDDPTPRQNLYVLLPQTGLEIVPELFI